MTFDILKGILKDRKFSSNDEIEEVIVLVGNDLTVADVQTVFHKWMSRSAWSLRMAESRLLNE
jgi:hypothetical protein